MKRRRAVITGLGIVTSLGLGLQKNWASAISGRCGIKAIDGIYPDCPIYAAGKVGDSDIGLLQSEFPEEAEKEGELRSLFALWAAQEALRDANLEGQDLSQSGISFASGLAINRLEDISQWVVGKTFDYREYYKGIGSIHRESILRNNSHRPAALIASKYGLKGRNITTTSACASATQAIGLALRSVQRGEADIMLAGGAESMINPVGLVFFVLLVAACTSRDTNCCRPFDLRRSGLVMGEGAAFLVIESEEGALQRGASIYCECSGYGSSLDAYQVTAPEPEGRGAFLSMKRALQDAGLHTTDIDYINAHGTSTKLNDLAETIAIKELFGGHAYKLKISSSKSIIGHLLAASGAPEAVFTVMSVHEDMIHPTVNLINPDPRCDLDYTANKAEWVRVRAALSNSFGFGGQNASVVFKKY